MKPAVVLTLLLFGCSSAAPRSSARNPVEAPREGLANRWVLKQVSYRDGRPAFVPKHHGDLTLDERGGAGWSDGCNSFGAQYTASNDRIAIQWTDSTEMACYQDEEDVHYERVTHFELDGNRLLLRTQTQTYSFERYPFTRMSWHAWSLYAIRDPSNGEALEIDRFRMEYSNLLLEIERDQTFVFRDLDGQLFRGSLEVGEGQTVQMAYDADSLLRLAQRPGREAKLRDRTQNFEPTTEPVPSTYAQRLDWRAVRTFEIRAASVAFGGVLVPMDFLIFATDTHEYVFAPR